MGRTAASAFLRAWQSRAPVAATLAALDAYPHDDVAAALAAIDALFADDGFAADTVAACIAAASVDTGSGIGFPALGEGVQEGLLLIQHPLATVSLAVVPHAVLGARKAAAAGEGMIGFAGTISRYRVLRAGGARLGWWRCARIDAAFDAVTAPACRRDRTQRLADGDWLLVDGAEEGFVVEAATDDLVLLQATLTAGRAPLRTEHDATTLAYAAASATDPAASHRQMMATLLRVLGRADAVPALASMTDDPDFFVRWHALRELTALDPAAALPALRRMTRDPRADIAMAASATLARFEPCPA